MRRFYCSNCANEVHFESLSCLRCGFELHYQALADQFVASPHTLVDGANQTEGHACGNRIAIGCNWLVPPDSQSSYCESCQRTLIIPDLSANQNLERWARLERAKRLLFYSLNKFGLAFSTTDGNQAKSLRFEFKADQLQIGGQTTKAITGHNSGTITINISEADDDVREQHRVALGEPYRTLIGHFRHEVGHYYWERLVADPAHYDAFRAMFGDERTNYSEALQRYYQVGAPRDWNMSCVTSYASSHPWEDFAETWAHYFHIVDGLETAQSYQLGSHDLEIKSQSSPYHSNDFQEIIGAWVPLTIAMNAMNRSIGNHDFYPFVLTGAISDKLQFIHKLIHHR